MLSLYDAHDHLQDEWLTPHRADVFAELARIGVRRAVANGTSELDWVDVTEIAGAQKIVLPSFGLHPWHVGNRSAKWKDALVAQLDASPGAAIGEIGLDRWILDRARADDSRLAGLRRAPLEEQLDVFRWQLALAAERNRPASIHCLDAFGQMLETLKSSPRPACGFLLHAYSGSAEMVESFVPLGAYFSFNGSFLDPRKRRLREVYAAIPLDRLLVETDAPAMRLPADREHFPPLATPDGPVANHPANLLSTYEGLAAWRNLSVEALAAQVEKNFQHLFGT